MPPEEGGRIEALGIRLAQVPRPVMILFGVVLSLGTAVTIYQHEVAQPGQKLISLQEANEAMQADVLEYGKHLGEAPEKQFTMIDNVPPGRGTLTVANFKDSCILITRTTDAGLRAKLITDLAQDKDRKHARLKSPSLLDLIEQPVAAQGRCWNPHPNQFRTWYGKSSGGACGWVEVWRQWQDGCTHYQLFDTCHQIWDPAIRWTYCVH